MEPNKNTGADPKDNQQSFDDAVGKEQPVNKVETGASKNGEQPGSQTPDAGGSKPPEQSGKKDTSSQGDQPADKSQGGDKTFWGKFKTEEEAKKSYDEAQTKIIEQGKELNDLKTGIEKNEQFLSLLDKALVKHPELAGQLKTVLAEASKAVESEPETPDIDSLLDKKFEEREIKAKTKAGIDKWIEEHEDFKDPEIGHKILDTIEAEKLPFNAKTLQLVYDSVTKDNTAKKAADEALKKEEVKNLERENAAATGGGSPDNKGKESEASPFDELVGESINPNKVRTR